MNTSQPLDTGYRCPAISFLVFCDDNIPSLRLAPIAHRSIEYALACHLPANLEVHVPQPRGLWGKTGRQQRKHQSKTRTCYVRQQTRKCCNECSMRQDTREGQMHLKSKPQFLVELSPCRDPQKRLPSCDSHPRSDRLDDHSRLHATRMEEKSSWYVVCM